MKGWAGDLHAIEDKDDVAAVIRGEMSGTDFPIQELRWQVY